MCAQIATSLLGGGRDFVFGGLNYFANIFFSRSLDAAFFSGRFFFGGGLHASDFYIQLAQTIFDIGQAAIGVLTGGARFFQSLLDGLAAIAEHGGQELASGPEHDRDDDGEVQSEQEEMRAMNAPTDLIGQPANGTGMLKTFVFFLFFGFVLLLVGSCDFALLLD